MVTVANVPGGVSALIWYCQAGMGIAGSDSLSGWEKAVVSLLNRWSNKRVVRLTGYQAFGGGACEIHNEERSRRGHTQAPPIGAHELHCQDMAPTLGF